MHHRQNFPSPPLSRYHRELDKIEIIRTDKSAVGNFAWCETIISRYNLIEYPVSPEELAIYLTGKFDCGIIVYRNFLIFKHTKITAKNRIVRARHFICPLRDIIGNVEV